MTWTEEHRCVKSEDGQQPGFDVIYEAAPKAADEHGEQHEEQHYEVMVCKGCGSRQALLRRGPVPATDASLAHLVTRRKGS